MSATPSKPRLIPSTGLILICLGLLCGCRTRPICILYGKPHTVTPPEIADQWIGFSDGRLKMDTQLYRLDLRPNQTGLLTLVYDTTETNGIFRWEISGWDISSNNVLTCHFLQHDNLEPLVLTSPVMLERLDASLRNGEGGWKSQIIFWRRSDFDKKLQALEQAPRLTTQSTE